jgi:phenylacetate-CoA ligase
MLSKLVFKIGCIYRNKSLKLAYNELKSTEFASEEELRLIQENRIRDLLDFCFKHSKFYKSKLDSIGYSKLRNKSPFLILEKLPFTSKSELIEFNSEIHTNNSFSFKKLFFSETSGSTGQALTFYKDEFWDSYNRASIFRGMSWFDVYPYDKNGYFWGFDSSFISSLKTRFLDSLVNRFRVFSYSERELNKFLSKLSSAKYIEGYSSMIYEVAKIAASQGLKFDNIKLIKGTSEKIYPHYHKITKDVFGCKVVSEYGSAESGIIAFECPIGNMHINEETCFVEVFEGKVYVTNLIARSFPTIRYELGDYVVLSDEKCACGRSHKIIKEVTGRVGVTIIGKKDSQFPSLTLYYVFKTLALEYGLELSYKCVQSVPGELKVYLEHEADESVKSQVISTFKSYFEDFIEVDIYFTDKLSLYGKKLKDFESEIAG